jgi:hypothetical protein
VTPKKHVTSRQNDRAGHQVGIVRRDQPALPGIDVLVGLRGVAGRQPVPPRGRSVPLRPHRVRAILDHPDTQSVADLHQPVHVADMPPHVAEQQHPRPARPGLPGEVVDVDGQRLGRLDEDRLGADAGDRARHRGEREAVRQHLVTMTDADGAQGAGHGVTAGGDGEAVFRAGIGRELLLQARDLPDLVPDEVVAVQAARAHHRDRGLDGGLGDRLLLGEAPFEDGFFHGRTFRPRPPAVKIARHPRPAGPWRSRDRGRHNGRAGPRAPDRPPRAPRGRR